MPPEEFHRCDGCHSDRKCRRYGDLWLCIKGPDHCWSWRRSIRAMREYARVGAK